MESDDDEAETLPEDDDQDTDSQDIELEPLEDQVKSYEPAQDLADINFDADDSIMGNEFSDSERLSATLKDPQLS